MDKPKLVKALAPGSCAGCMFLHVTDRMTARTCNHYDRKCCGYTRVFIPDTPEGHAGYIAAKLEYHDDD